MTTTALLPVASLWVGERLSALERLSMTSFVACGHTYELYAYRDYPDLPDGVQLKDANAILPEREIYYSAGPQETQEAPALKVSPFANWFRWELLSRRRCWWADTDIVCLKALDLEGELVAGIQATRDFNATDAMVSAYDAMIGQPNGAWTKPDPVVNNALVKCTDRKHPVVCALRRLCRDPELYRIYTKLSSHERVRCDVVHGVPEALVPRKIFSLMRRCLRSRKGLRKIFSSDVAGPESFTEMILKYKAWSDVKDRSYFYPVFWHDWRTLFDDTYADQHDPFPRAYTVHLWNDMLRRDNVDKDQSFVSRSFVERMKRRYLG